MGGVWVDYNLMTTGGRLILHCVEANFLIMRQTSRGICPNARSGDGILLLPYTMGTTVHMKLEQGKLQPTPLSCDEAEKKRSTERINFFVNNKGLIQ